MAIRYSMGRKEEAKNLKRCLYSLAAGVAMFAVLIPMGLKSRPASDYIWLDIIILLLLVAGVFLTNLFSPRLDGKANRMPRVLRRTCIAGAISVVIWIVLTITDLHYLLSVPIYLAALACMGIICLRCWQYFKSMANLINSGSDDNCVDFKYPGIYEMSGVHSQDGLNSPFGTVLIGRHTVLFVISSQFKGYTLYKPDGSVITMKKSAFSSTRAKEHSLNEYDLIHEAQSGVDRLIKIVEESCKKRSVPVPNMVFTYCVFLPNYSSDMFVLNESSFNNIPWSKRSGSYEAYTDNANDGRPLHETVVFSIDELTEMFQGMERQFAEDCPNNSGDPAATAACIAEGCGLIPDEKASAK